MRYWSYTREGYQTYPFISIFNFWFISSQKAVQSHFFLKKKEILFKIPQKYEKLLANLQTYLNIAATTTAVFFKLI